MGYVYIVNFKAAFRDPQPRPIMYHYSGLGMGMPNSLRETRIPESPNTRSVVRMFSLDSFRKFGWLYIQQYYVVFSQMKTKLIGLNGLLAVP